MAVSVRFCLLQMNSIDVNRRIALARKYLEDEVSIRAASDPFALCIISYALVRAGSSKVGDVLQMLETLAKVEGNHRWKNYFDNFRLDLRNSALTCTVYL